MQRLHNIVKALEEQISAGGSGGENLRRSTAIKTVMQEINRLQLELDAITLDENDVLSDSFYLKVANNI